MKIELSHDLLAKKIYDKASTEDKMLIKIRNFIKDRFAYFKENKVLLSREDLHYIGPYLKQLTLEQHELIFIDRSKHVIWLKRVAVGTVVVAVIFIIAYFMNKTERVKARSQILMEKRLKEYKEMETEAKKLSTALVESREGLDATEEQLRLALLKLQEKNDTLLHDYAVYKVSHDYDKEKLVEDLKIAQSAKLSELAAPITTDNQKYAFQLAAQAWYLNSENQQAIKAIYEIVGKKSAKTPSKQETLKLIKKQEATLGKLSQKQMNAIFSPENRVVANGQKSKITKTMDQITKEPTAPTMTIVPPPQQEEKRAKVKAEKTKIQQKLQNQIQRQEQKQGPINFPK